MVLALLALGPAARAEVTLDAGGERYAVEGIDGPAALYSLTGAPLASSPTWTATGENYDDVLGWSDGGTCIASAGDVNGDGYADLVVGAPYHDADGVNKGKVYVYHGSPSGPSAMPGFTATGHTDWDQLGHGVAGVGEVNGDGSADILFGAPGVDASGNARGQAYLYLGGSVESIYLPIIIKGP
ncbi:MAG: integrin alpha [Anaerolineae bacterium]